MLILLINTGLYLAMMLRMTQQGGSGFGDPDLQTLVDFGAKYAPYIIGRGEWWRLITAAFLHGGLLHIVMNSWVLFDLGPQVNEAFGTPRFLSIYFVSSVTGYLASLYWSSVGFDRRVGGAMRTDRRHDRAGHARSFGVWCRPPASVHPVDDLPVDLRTDYRERGQRRSHRRAGGRVRDRLRGRNAGLLWRRWRISGAWPRASRWRSQGGRSSRCSCT